MTKTPVILKKFYNFSNHKMFLSSHEKYREMFRRLQLHSPKGEIAMKLIFWHLGPLLGNDLLTNDYTIAVPR